MPSLLDDLWQRLTHPNARRCGLCMLLCPTDLGKPLPPGWDVALPALPFLQTYPPPRGENAEDVLCPACADLDRRLRGEVQAEMNEKAWGG